MEMWEGTGVEAWHILWSGHDGESGWNEPYEMREVVPRPVACSGQTMREERGFARGSDEEWERWEILEKPAVLAQLPRPEERRIKGSFTGV